MGNEITINKTTALLLVGLFIAIVAGGYLAFVMGKAPEQAQPGPVVHPSGEVQEVYLKVSSQGYDRREIVVRKGIPVRLHFTAVEPGCWSQLVIYGMNVKALSVNGQEAIVEFTPDKEGTFEYNCGMKMMDPGRFVVMA